MFPFSFLVFRSSLGEELPDGTQIRCHKGSTLMGFEAENVLFGSGCKSQLASGLAQLAQNCDKIVT